MTTRLLLASICVALPGLAQADEPPTLDHVLEPIRAAHKLPALAAAIVRGNDIVALGVVGERKLGDPAKAKREDLWHLGSCTKAMTATLVARLVEGGHLSWETSLGKLFGPALGEGMHDGWRPVTVAQLLAHRGGAPTPFRGELWERLKRSQAPLPEQRLLIVQDLLSRAPLHSPGEEFVYSNGGYVLLGAAMERLTGSSWEDLMREQVFQPLHMTSAGYGPPRGPGPLDQPWGHVAGSDGRPIAVEPGPLADNPLAIGPAGTVHCTLQDWARFASLQLRGARGEETDYLQPDTFTQLHSPPAGTYAAGWIAVEREWAGGVALTHGGSNTLWKSLLWLAPQRDLAFLVVTNYGGPEATPACDEAVGALIRWEQESSE